MKTKIKHAGIALSALLITVGAVWTINCTIFYGFKVVNFIKNPVGIEPAMAMVNIPKPEKELEMKAWLKKTIEEAGISWDEASKVIQCESGGDPNAHAVNWDNKAGVDRGIWQLNSYYHPEISNECSYDYKCATYEAIRIYREWGNSWNAWSCKKVLK